MKIRNVLFAAVAVVTLLSGTSFAADSGADAYTCMKVKDLNTPAAVVYAPVPQSLTAYAVGTSTCTIGKLTQICMASNVGSHVADNFTVAQCCFRVKCDDALSNTMGIGITNTIENGGTFTGAAALTKVAQVCEPCTWSGL